MNLATAHQRMSGRRPPIMGTNAESDIGPSAHTAAKAASSPSSGKLLRTLAPVMAVVFAAYLIIGIAMPVLPLYVHEGLGLSTFMVGVAAGVEFAAALVSRFWSGRYADTRGAKRSMAVGLVLGSIAGLLYLGSLQLAHRPHAALAVLLAGRIVLGGSESFVITGALSHGLALGGSKSAGTVIAWVGTALWAAYAAGAPAGSALFAAHGFAAVAVATFTLPLLALAVLGPMRAVPLLAGARPPIARVLGAVALPGFGMALTAVGFGAITTFGALMFSERGWSAAWVAFTAVSVFFILGRVFFGQLPDRLGGARVALVCVIIEALGLGLIWLAPAPWLVFVGSAITGVGYSLVYPGFGVEAVRRAPPESRGLAMGAFTAFLDLSLGLSSPALGLIAGRTGLSFIFLVSALLVVSATMIALRLAHSNPVRRVAAS